MAAAVDSNTANTADYKKKKEPNMAITTTAIEWQPTAAEIDPLIEPSLYRLTEGLPTFELKLIATEAQACEELLEKEIKQLEEELARISSSQEGSSSTVPMDAVSTDAKDSAAPPSTNPSDVSSSLKKSPVDLMLASEFTPPDRYFTVSALLGRLRDDLATPLPPNSTLPALRAQHGLLQPPLKKKKTSMTPTNAGATAAAAVAVASTGGTAAADATESSAIPIIKEPLRPLTDLDKQKRVLALESLPDYRNEHDTPTVLLALWKKISTHRTSVVFRRPVNPKEAPSYADRILFPMDLSLIRKMIVARMVNSYADLHMRVGLICHNCVKYNGRESDYGLVTREFEGVVDELIVAAVAAAAAAASTPVQLPAATEGTTDSTNTTMDDTLTDIPTSAGVVAPVASPAIEAMVEQPPVEPPPKAAPTTTATLATTTLAETEIETPTAPISTPAVEAEDTKKLPPSHAPAPVPDEAKTEKKTEAATPTKKKS